MKDQTREDPRIVAAAERQMKVYTLCQEVAERRLRMDREHAKATALGKYLTISRESGAGGSEVAELVARRLGWEVLDRNLLDCVAQRYHLAKSMLELVDETGASWAYDTLGPWLDQRIIPHEKYVSHLSQIVLAAAQRGNVVIVGRGARFILPQEQGLGVRIIASEKYRVAQIMRRCGLSAAEARRYIHEVDEGRRQFVQHFFHRDVADPHAYDLVIHVEHVGALAAADLIVRAVQG